MIAQPTINPMTEAQRTLALVFDRLILELLGRAVALDGPLDGVQFIENMLIAHAVAMGRIGYSSPEGVRQYLVNMIDWRIQLNALAGEVMGRA